MDKLFAFVLMPFKEEFTDIYQLGIKEASQAIGIDAQRVDEQKFTGNILQRIYAQIEAADVVIAELSEKNENVYYELGYAHAKGKDCILLKHEESEIPFDLKHYRHIIYKNVTDLKDQLKIELEAIKKEIEKIKKSKIQVIFKTKNEKLTTSDYYADLETDLIFDLINSSESDSPEINGIYLYTGSTTEIYEGNNLCGSIKSDSLDFTMMHQITPLKTKLAKGQWHQVKVKAIKRLANKMYGDEIKFEYSISGRLKFRLLTNKGVFDYEYPVNMDVSEIPF